MQLSKDTKKNLRNMKHESKNSKNRTKDTNHKPIIGFYSKSLDSTREKSRNFSMKMTYISYNTCRSNNTFSKA